MYSVSNAFKIAMNNPVQEHRITGTIGSVSFDESNIVDGSFSISNQSTDTNDVVLGSCYVGELTAEFTGLSIGWSSWIGKVITPSFGLKVGNSWETVPLGIFKVSKATHTAFGVQVTAYDYMTKFDKKFKKSHFMNLAGMYNIINQMCTDCGVTLGMTQAQIEALPNGDRTGINIYGSKGKKSEFANDITTNRDLLFWVAQTLGCFATMDRSGHLVFRKYSQNVVDVISNEHRLEGATFEDYITHYIGIYVENLDDNTEDYYGYDTAALTAELQETSAEISSDQEDITELQADLVEWAEKLAQGQCTQEEYDAAVAEINAQIKAKQKDIKQLTKRVSWLEKALQSGGDDGSDMVLGANPLTMAANKTTRDQQRREILGALDDISYTPFTASVVCGCIYDLGDVIQFSGGLYNSENDSFGCVMAYTYTHNGGTELQGFGVDPAIVVVRNKTQKSVDRASKNSVDAPRNYIGTSDPTGGGGGGGDAVAGKDGDIFVRVGSGNLIDIIYDHGSYFVDGGVIKDSENKYSITVNGTPSDPNRNYIVYRLLGLTVGAEYSYSLKVHFNIGHTWGNYGGVDDFRIGDDSVTNVLVKTNSEREYSGTFTAKESGGIVPLIFEFSDSKDGVPMFFYCEDLLITPIDNSVKGIYVNDGGAWKNVDYVNDVSQTQSETGGTEIAEINNTNGTKTKIYQKTVEANPTGTATETLSSMNIGGTLYELGGGNVDDVKVDNVSVVTNKIANINTMTGADGTNAGEKGLVPAPTATDNEKYLRGDGTWQTVSGGGSAEMLAPTPFIYSETEEQVGIWIDGKPLYAKTKSFTNVSKSGSLSFGVANAETVFIKDIGKTSDSIPMPYVHGSAPSNNIGGFLTKTSSDVTWEFRSGNDAPSTLSGFMTLLYTKTTDTAWQGGFKAYGFTPVIYSEEEREIGVGENGKPLYQKTLNSGVISADSIVSTGLTNIESCHVIASETIENNGSVEFSPFVISMYNYQGSGTEYGFIYFDVSNHEIKYVNQSRSTTVKIRAVVQYTKTTDTAGSGKYTTLGTPAVHYSTDEQVIGTWIDGKTLYQKTVTTGGNVPSGATLIQRISQTGYDTIQYTKTS